MTDFWRAFFDYYGLHDVASRIDDFTSRLRATGGLAPDKHLEERRARRAEAKEKLLSNPTKEQD